MPLATSLFRPLLSCLLALLGAGLGALARSAPTPAADPALRSESAALPVTGITWLMPDSRSAGAGRASLGDSDELVAFLRQQLPQIQQRLLVANAKRGWQMLARGERVCLGSVLRTPEREPLAYFLPAQWVLPPRLIVRRDRLEALPRSAKGEVELPRLLADSELRGALFEGHSHGRAIDAQLAAQGPSPRLNLYAQLGAADQLLQMLRLGRADFTIDYEFALTLLHQPAAEAGAELLSLPIQGADQPVIGHLACPRTAWGRAALLRVAQVLGAPAGIRFLKASMKARLSPQARRQYAAKLDAFYKDQGLRTPAL